MGVGLLQCQWVEKLGLNTSLNVLYLHEDVHFIVLKLQIVLGKTKDSIENPILAHLKTCEESA